MFSRTHLKDVPLSEELVIVFICEIRMSPNPTGRGQKNKEAINFRVPDRKLWKHEALKMASCHDIENGFMNYHNPVKNSNFPQYPFV